MHATQIVAYSFRADTYSPSAIIDALPTGEGEAYDGWGFGAGAEPRTPEDVEAALTELALAFGIDRFDESSFDSGDFPKVVFSSQVDDWDEETLINGDGDHESFSSYYYGV